MSLEFDKIVPSARRHKISDERMLYVANYCKTPLEVGDPRAGEDDLLLFLGPDRNGVPLEVMGRVREDGGVTLFHAMKMRDQYLETYEELMKWE